MSENNSSGPGSLSRPGQPSAPRPPRPPGSKTRSSIPKPVLFGVLGVVVAAAVGAIVVFHPGMPKLLPTLSGTTVSSSAPGVSGAAPQSQQGGEAGGRPVGESPSSEHAARPRSAAASAHHSSSRSSAPTASTRPDPRDPDVRSRRVSFRDLDLRSHTGACTALKRIKYAAAEVCPDDSPELGLWHVRQECLQDSISRAIKDTHNAQLQALYSKKPTGC